MAEQESDFEALPLRLAYSFLTSNGLGSETDEIRNSREHLGSYTSSLRRAKIVALLRKKGLFQKFIETNWPFGATPGGQKKIKFYDNVYSRYERVADTNGDDEELEKEEEAEEVSHTVIQRSIFVGNCLGEQSAAAVL